MYTTQITTTTASQLVSGLQQIPGHWALTPVTDNKRPYRKNWQQETALTRQALIDELQSGRAFGYGIRTGEVSGGILAIDADGGAAGELLKKLSNGDLPDTVIFSSGKAGRRQLLYLITEEYWQVVKTIKLKTGVKGDDGKEQLLEFRWNGLQSVLPPSVHPETGRYYWENSPQDVEVAQCPNWVIELMLSEEQTPPNRPLLLGDVSVPIALTIPLESCLAKQTRFLLETCGISKGGRNDTAAMLARDLLGTANYLDSIGQRYDGDPWDIFYNWCIMVGLDKDSPKGQPLRAWKSAQKSHPSPSCGVDGVNNCIRGWYLRTNKPSGRSYGSKFSGNGNEPPITELSLRDRILEIIWRGLSPATEKAALLDLAKQTSTQLKEIEDLARLLRNEAFLEDSRDNHKSEIDSLLLSDASSLELANFLPIELADPLKLWCKWLNIRPEVALSAVLTATSSLHKVGTELVIHRGQDFRVPPIIFSALVGESGQRKSPVFRTLIRKPLGQIQKEARVRYQREIEIYSRDLAAWEANPDGQPKPTKPGLEVYYFTDATGEGIKSQAQESPHKSLLALIDELAGLLNSNNKYRGGKGSDRQDMLSYFDGLGQTVLRASGIKVDVDRIYLSIFGTIQPDVLKKFTGDLTDADGHWARFLCVTQPLVAATLGDDTANFDITEMLTGYYRRIAMLPQLEYRLSPAAFKKYQQVYNQFEQMRVNHPKPGMRAIYSKMEGYIGRLALNLHVLDAAVSGIIPNIEISAATVESAIALANFYIDQIKLIHADSAADSGELSAMLAKLLKIATDKGKLTARDAVRSLNALKTNTQALDSFRELSAMGYGKVEKVKASWTFYPTVNGVNGSVNGVNGTVNGGIDTFKQRNINTFESSVNGVNGVNDFLKTFEGTLKSQPEALTVNESFNGAVNEKIALSIDSIDTIDSKLETIDLTSSQTVNGSVNGRIDTIDTSAEGKLFSVGDRVSHSVSKIVDATIDTIDTSSESIEIALSQTVNASVDATIDSIDTLPEVPQIEIGDRVTHSVDAIAEVPQIEIGDRVSHSVDAIAEVPQIEIGDRVTHSNPFHKRGNSSGVVETINDFGGFVVNWVEDGDNQLSKAQRTYSADELRLLNPENGDRMIAQVQELEQTTITLETITNLSLRTARKVAGVLGISQKVAGKDLSKQDLIDAIVECWQKDSAAVVDASILQG